MSSFSLHYFPLMYLQKMKDYNHESFLKNVPCFQALHFAHNLGNKRGKKCPSIITYLLS